MYAMVSYMDDEFSKVLSALKKKGMYKDSLIVFHSDNGGEVMGAGLCGGNNWPLTGGKFSLNTLTARLGLFALRPPNHPTPPQANSRISKAGFV